MKPINFELAKFINLDEEYEEAIKKDIVIYFSKKKKFQKMQQKDLQQLLNIAIFELDLNWQSEI
jgi:hypothetical protein